eukprot:scaffold1690_cov192-Skeletonema_menzelii.AAC.6
MAMGSIWGYMGMALPGLFLRVSTNSDECPKAVRAASASYGLSMYQTQEQDSSLYNATGSSPRMGRRHAVQVRPTKTSDTNSFQQSVDTSCQSTQPKADVLDDLILCQQELKRSREEVQKQKQAEEIKRPKGAIQALISSSH